MTVLEIHSELPLTSPAPVRLPLPDGALLTAGDLRLREMGSGRTFPAQADAEGGLIALVGPVAEGSHRFALEAAPGDEGGVRVTEVAGNKVEVTVGGKPLTTYHFDPSFARPFFYPVFGPGGRMVTRNYPMKTDVPGETHDHPHHRSLWTAYGEVNDVDDWSEGPKHGWIRHQRFRDVTSGPVFGGFVAENLWTGPDNQPLLRETRRLRFYAGGDDRQMFDYDVTFTASQGDVKFGDTKEGGIISFRVATSMDGNKGGRIENADGGVGEKQCWGKASAWCDYSGPVGDAVVGIAIMDHPANFRHPTHWHVRDYGLMGTNYFGDSSFSGDGGKRGEYTLKKDTQLTFRYRVLLHPGDARQGKVSDVYHGFVQPPKG